MILYEIKPKSSITCFFREVNPLIISASRRTDIPSYYSDWFFHRIKEGFVYVRNPMNPHRISKISLSPDVVDGIVFWTKNPIPMIDRLKELDPYIYYFQFTLTPYDNDVETNIPSKNEIIVPAFQRLSKKIGKDRVIWRYDPILFSEKHTINYHTKCFQFLAEKLADYTEKCTISFLDFYRNTAHNTAFLGIYEPSYSQKEELMFQFSRIAEQYHLEIDTCAEEIDLHKFHINHAHCIDKERFEKLGNYKLKLEKDKKQRPMCGCASSIDIGAYHTCKNGCIYCYANLNPKILMRNIDKHNPESPLLYGTVQENDMIADRSIKSSRILQMNLFD